jgi:hypothetical protein
MSAREEAPCGATRTAWDRLAATGHDMSLLTENLRLTPLERIRQHDRALSAALALRRGIEELRARS